MDTSGAAEPGPCQEAEKVLGEAVGGRRYSRDTKAQDVSVAAWV